MINHRRNMEALAQLKETRDAIEVERDRLWDACLNAGHGPDGATAAWYRQQGRLVCEGPNSDGDPCPICTEMAKQQPSMRA